MAVTSPSQMMSVWSSDGNGSAYISKVNLQDECKKVTPATCVDISLQCAQNRL